MTRFTTCSARCLAPSAAVLLAALASAPAQAQSLFEIPDEEKETYLDLGVAVLSRAPYVGSEEDDLGVLPYVNAEYEGRFFFNPAIGAGVNVINRNGFSLAALGYFASGREGDDTPFVPDEDETTLSEAELDILDEAFEVDGSFTVGGIASYTLPFARVDVRGQVPVTGDVDGFRGDVALTTRLPLGRNGFFAPGVRATYTTDSWNDVYYGISAEQSALTGLDLFEADDDWTLGAHGIVSFEVGNDISLLGTVVYSALQGNLKDSPLTPDNDAFTLVGAVIKRF